MWYPFPTCPVRATGFVPTVFISRHGLTHAGAHTPWPTVVTCFPGHQSPQPPLTHHWVSFLTDSPSVLAHYTQADFFHLSAELSPRVASIRPTFDRNDRKWKSFSCIIHLPSPVLWQLSEHWFMEWSFLLCSFASSVKHLVSGYYKYTFKLLMQTWQTNFAKKTNRCLFINELGIITTRCLQMASRQNGSMLCSGLCLGRWKNEMNVKIWL